MIRIFNILKLLIMRNYDLTCDIIKIFIFRN